MHDRIKQLRKSLEITQEEFSKKIGIKRNTLANYEIGRNEPIDAVIFSICRVFNVNETWLRTGTGEMFQQLLPEDEYVRAAAEISKDDDEKIIQQIIVEYWKLNTDAKKHIKEYILNIAKSIKKED